MYIILLECIYKCIGNWPEKTHMASGAETDGNREAHDTPTGRAYQESVTQGDIIIHWP